MAVTSLGKRIVNALGLASDSATSDDMSDITTTSSNAKLRLILNRLSSDAFSATVQGSARTALDTMIAQLATYFAASGGAMSIQVNNQTARTNLEQAFEDFMTVAGCDGSNVFDPAMFSGNQTTFEAAFAAIGTELAKVPKSDSTVSWNSTALAAIEGECEDAIEADNLDHLMKATVSDTSDHVDMTTEVPDDTVLSNIMTVAGNTSDFERRDDSLQAIGDRLTDTGKDVILHQIIVTGNCADTAEATCAAIDALNGPIKDIKATIYVDGATAGNITPKWYVTSVNAPTTFAVALAPAPSAQNPGAAACIGAYEFGDLAEGLQLELRLDSAGDDSGIDYFAELTYIGSL